VVSLHAELVFLGDIFRQTGYTDWQIAWPSPPLTVTQSDKKPDFLPNVGLIFSCISRVLSLHIKKSVGLPHGKISSSFWSVKDDLGLKTPEVYSTPCKCGQVHIE
jgi:hypothetical protein